jgi:proteic killer suppression protein
MLNVATHPKQLNAPGLRLHMLEPKKAGRYAVWVDENYRVTFHFMGTDIEGVDYEDYH